MQVIAECKFYIIYLTIVRNALLQILLGDIYVILAGSNQIPFNLRAFNFNIFFLISVNGMKQLFELGLLNAILEFPSKT